MIQISNKMSSLVNEFNKTLDVNFFKLREFSLSFD